MRDLMDAQVYPVIGRKAWFRPEDAPGANTSYVFDQRRLTLAEPLSEPLLPISA